MFNSIRKIVFSKEALLFRILFWLLAEVWLGYLGIDDLADYSEFLFENSSPSISQISERIKTN